MCVCVCVCVHVHVRVCKDLSGYVGTVNVILHIMDSIMYKHFAYAQTVDFECKQSTVQTHNTYIHVHYHTP